MFSANINNISVYMAEETGRTTQRKPPTRRKLLIMLYRVHLTMSGIPTHNVSGDSDRKWLHKKHVNLNS